MNGAKANAAVSIHNAAPALALARKTSAAVQTDPEIRSGLRGDYAEGTTGLMRAGHIVAIESQTIAAANNYWR